MLHFKSPTRCCLSFFWIPIYSTNQRYSRFFFNFWYTNGRGVENSVLTHSRNFKRDVKTKMHLVWVVCEQVPLLRKVPRFWWWYVTTSGFTLVQSSNSSALFTENAVPHRSQHIGKRYKNFILDLSDGDFLQPEKCSAVYNISVLHTEHNRRVCHRAILSGATLLSASTIATRTAISLTIRIMEPFFIMASCGDVSLALSWPVITSPNTGLASCTNLVW